MPISSRVLRPRPIESGKIKLGGKFPPKAGKSHGVPQRFENENGPFFLITKTTRETPKDRNSNFLVDTALMEKLAPHYDPDKKLRKIPIMLHSSDIEEVFPSQLAAYNGTRLYCRGDGEHPATRFDEEKPRQVPCTCEYYKAESGSIICKPSGNFWCTILADGMTSLATRHVFRTHASGSIRALQSGLEDIKNMVGILHGVKMWLKCMWRDTQRPDGSATRVAVAYLDMLLEDVPGAQRMALAMAQQRAHVMQIAGRGERLSLPAAGDPRETPEEQEAVAREWFPTRPGDGTFDDDINEAQDCEVNDETGEVTFKSASEASGTTAPPGATAAAPSERPTQPAVPAANGTSAAASSSAHVAATTSAPAGAVAVAGTKPSPSVPTIAIDPATEGDPLSSNAQLGKALAQALMRLASLRGIEAADLKAAQKDILVEVTTNSLGTAVNFKELTIHQADVVLKALGVLIAKKEDW